MLLAVGGALFVVLRELHRDAAFGRLHAVGTTLLAQLGARVAQGPVQGALDSLKEQVGELGLVVLFVAGDRGPVLLAGDARPAEPLPALPASGRGVAGDGWAGSGDRLLHLHGHRQRRLPEHGHGHHHHHRRRADGLCGQRHDVGRPDLTVPQLTGVLANDTIGADAAGAVVGLAAGDTGLDSTGTMTVTGLHGTLTIAADGSYSYLANNVVSVGRARMCSPTPCRMATAITPMRTLTINFEGDNNVPSAGETSASVDDEGLSHGIAGGTGDIVVTPDADANEATFSGTLSFNFGGDGAGSVTFAAMNGATGHIGTEDVTYAWDSGSGILTATVSGGERDGSDLFTVKVTDPLTGEYTVTLLDNVLHSEGGNENNAMADLTYTVTDANNDADNGTLTVTFDDDMPAVHDSSLTGLPNSLHTGNILTDSAIDGSFGADGGHVESIAAVGSARTPNFDNVITEDTPNDFDLEVIGQYGGRLKVDSDTGNYEYKAPRLSNPGDKLETFEFTVIDGDGDTASAQLHMLIDDPNG